MDYTYEYTKLQPKSLWAQIKYTAAGKLDVYKNVQCTDFTEAGLDALAVTLAESVVKSWELADTQPDDANIPPAKTVTYSAPVEKTYRREQQPQFDMFTERLETTRTETDTEIVDGWQVISLSAQEQDEFLQGWRNFISSSMRQARLALKQQGLLATVQSNIDALPEESQIEWEYAARVERKSPLVASLGAALGLTETQLDDLFKLAITL